MIDQDWEIYFERVLAARNRNQHPPLEDIPSVEDLPIPAGHRLLVQPFAPPSQTKGGIYLADSVKEVEGRATQLGKVLLVGPSAWKTLEMGGRQWAEPGDIVMFTKHAPMRFQLENGVTLLILNDEDVIAIIPDHTLIKKGRL